MSREGVVRMECFAMDKVLCIARRCVMMARNEFIMDRSSDDEWLRILADG